MDASSWDYKPNSYDTRPTAATATGLKWNTMVSEGVSANVSYDPTEAHHGYSSLKVELNTGQDGGTAGVTNRGIGNEGLYLKAGKDYEGMMVWIGSLLLLLPFYTIFIEL
jgi:hypothetical protein